MTTANGNRNKFFPAIEKKHEEKIAVWIKRLKELDTDKYPQQIAFLRENYGFSQVHANAIVMYHRGSTTSKRFGTPETYFKSLSPSTAKITKAIFSAITTKDKALELVVAWNQPMLRLGKDYIFGLSVSKNHITLNPFSGEVLTKFAPRLTKFLVNKKTFQVPLDWKVDAELLQGLVNARIAELHRYNT